jgi:hypothetical protein
LAPRHRLAHAKAAFANGLPRQQSQASLACEHASVQPTTLPAVGCGALMPCHVAGDTSMIVLPNRVDLLRMELVIHVFIAK